MGGGLQNGSEVLPLPKGGGAEKVLAMLKCVCGGGGGGWPQNVLGWFLVIYVVA